MKRQPSKGWGYRYTVLLLKMLILLAFRPKTGIKVDISKLNWAKKLPLIIIKQLSIIKKVYIRAYFLQTWGNLKIERVYPVNFFANGNYWKY